ncbi:hypothetical protein D9613_006017 [Agrocybe pediades]|uniref:SET domain-containing protein n=1 Tax=Agrocybe pediades TaxID=84607 RepID=A0A8H4VRI4_9AGAR|nr:hypothetical protein D9613_006017 [Agrocybe pediades]
MAQNRKNKGHSTIKGNHKTPAMQSSKSALSKTTHPGTCGWKLFTLGMLAAIVGVAISAYWTPLLRKRSPTIHREDVVLYDVPFVVVDIPGKGKGAVASRDIKQGERILREKPLFRVDLQITSSPIALMAEKLAGLTPHQRKAFEDLSYVNFNLDPVKHPQAVALAKFETNAVAAGKDRVGIFPTMARLNHGCSSAFNVVYSWRDDEEVLVVYALKAIKEGQELLTTYLDSKKPRAERRAFLNKHYGFNCTCSVCSLPDKLSKASDDRLTKIKALYAKFATWGNNEIDGAQAIQTIGDIWTVEDEEGYWSERGSLAYDATWIAASHSDASATQAWARKAVEWFSYEIGPDTTQVQSLLMVIERPELHKAWGTRPTLMVGSPEPTN